MQKLGGKALCTFKLHEVVHHLGDMELNMGTACEWLELWVERMIQFAKLAVEHRAVHDSEQVYWQYLLDSERLEELSHLYPEYCKTVDADKKAARAAEAASRKASGLAPRGGVHDEPDRDNYRLKGAGKRSIVAPYAGVEADAEWDAILRTMNGDTKTYRDLGWPCRGEQPRAVIEDLDPVDAAHETDRLDVVRFTHATLPNDAYFGSVLDACTSTDSSYSFVRMQVDGARVQNCIIRILYYVRLATKRPLDNMGVPVTGSPRRLRFAICRVWHAEPVPNRLAPGGSIFNREATKFWEVPDLAECKAYRSGALHAVLLQSLTIPTPHMIFRDGDATRGLFLRARKGSAAWS